MTATASAMQTRTMRTGAMLTRTPAMTARPRPTTPMAATPTRATAKISQTTRKRRRGRTLGQRLTPFLVAVAVGLTALAGGVALARRGAMAALPASVTIIVRPGDTIWSLAKSFGDNSAPMLDRLDSFADANDLDAGAGLFPGQRLLVPVADADTLNRLKDSGRLTSVALAPTQKGRL